MSHMSLNKDLRAPQDFQLCRWKVAIRPKLLRLRMGDAAITRKRLRLWDGCNRVTSQPVMTHKNKGGELEKTQKIGKSLAAKNKTVNSSPRPPCEMGIRHNFDAPKSCQDLAKKLGLLQGIWRWALDGTHCWVTKIWTKLSWNVLTTEMKIS